MTGIKFIPLKQNNAPARNSSGLEFMPLGGQQETVPDEEADYEMDPEEDNPLIFKKLFHLGSYGVKLLGGALGADTIKGQRIKKGEYANALLDRAKRTGGDAVDYFRKTPAIDVAKDAKKMIEGISGAATETLKGAVTNPLDTVNSFANGILDVFVESPIEALTGLRNNNGTPVIMQPDDYAKSVQENVANVVNIYIQRKLTSKFLAPPKQGPTALKDVSRAGNLVKVGAANLAAGGLAAIPDATIRNLGEDDYALKVANTMVSSTIMGTLVGTMFDMPRYNKMRMETQQNALHARVLLANEIAAENALRNTPDKPLADAIANVNGVATADKLVEAAIRAGLQNDGFVVPAIDPVVLEETINKVAPAVGAPLNVKLAKNYQSKTIAGQTMVKFEADFDRVAYLLRKTKKMTRSKRAMLKEVIAQTGLTLDQIAAHGRYLHDQVVTPLLASGLRKMLSQDEINATNIEAINSGAAQAINATDGARLADFNGQLWEKQGENFIGADGTIRPMTDQTLHQMFGKKKTGSPELGQLEVPQQNFNGNYNRDITDLQVTTSKTGATYLHSFDLDPAAKSLFEETGYLPNERVRFGNEDAYVQGFEKGKIKLLVPTKKGGLKPRNADPSTVGRYASNNLSKSVLDVNGKSALINAELTSESYFNKFADTVGSLFDANVKDELFPHDWDVSGNPVSVDGKPIVAPAQGFRTFNDIYLEAAQKLALSPEVAEQLKPAIYNHLQKQVLDKIVGGDEAANMMRIRDIMEKESDAAMENKAMYFNNLADQNGLYIDKENGLDLRRIQDGSLFYRANDINDAIDFVHKTGQAPLPNNIPPGILPDGFARLGTMSTDYHTKNGFLSHLIDNFNVAAISSWTIPVRDLFASIDNIAKRSGYEGGIFQHTEGINQAIEKKRVFIEQNRGTLEIFNKAVELAREGKADLSKVTGFIKSMTQGEVINEYLPRRMNNSEIMYGRDLANKLGAINESTSALGNAYVAAKDLAEVKGISFQEALTEATANRLISPQLHNIVSSFETMLREQDDNLFAPDAVLKYTDTVMNPGRYMDRAQYAEKNLMTKEEVQISTLLENFFDEMSKAVGIDPSAKRGGYLPTIKETKRFGRYQNRKYSEEFIHELGKTLDMRDGLEENPLVLAYMYMNTAANFKAGLNKSISAADAVVKDAVGKLPEAKGSVLNKAFSQYVDNVKGLPDLSETFGRATSLLLSEALGLGGVRGKAVAGITKLLHIDPSSVGALIESSLTGFRPIQGLRDIYSVIAMTDISLGPEYAKGLMYESTHLAPNEIAKLQLGNNIPYASAAEMLRPGADVTLRSNKKFNQFMEASIKYTGQTVVYARTLAGIHKTTHKIGREVFKQMRQGILSKEKGYERLAVDAHNPAVVREFDRYVKAGDDVGALDFLSKWNQKIVANNYGKNQTPLPTQRGIGKLFGQMGSWSMNAQQTAMNGMRSKHWARRTARAAKWQAAITIATAATGINLSTWMLNPAQFVAGVGPGVEQYLNIVRYGQQMMSFDDSQRAAGASGMARAVIPFSGGMTDAGRIGLVGSYAVRDILRGVEGVDSGEDPVTVAMKTLGFRFEQ
jgi:hypothetical protein